MENTTTIHIGMPKSASTTLQKNFFIRLPNINYIGLGIKNDMKKWLYQITHEEEINYEPDKIKERFAEKIDKRIPTIISTEFACAPVIPLSRLVPQDRKIIAKRFKKLIPDAQILIVIRNQFTIHKSLYAQLLKNEALIPTKQLKFNKWIDLNINLYERGIQNVFNFTDYYSLIEIYKNLFDNVKVVVFEEMIKNMTGFIQNEICPFMNLDAEDAMSFFVDKIERKRYTKNERLITGIGNFLKYYLGNPQKYIPVKKRKKIVKSLLYFTNQLPFGQIEPDYTENQKVFLRNYYSDSNRKLSKIINVNLGTYGYPV